MTEQEEFLQTLSGGGNVIFKGITKSGQTYTASKEKALANKEDNIYFLCGVNDGAQRFTDGDMGMIHYIRLDIDIRKGIKEYLGVDADQGDIEGYIEEIKDTLESNKYLKDWSYIVASGGGCHIYYSNKVGINIEPKIWQLAMKRIYGLYDKTILDILGEEYEYIKADRAVCNKARIMRMPGTINQKYGVECIILHSNKEAQSPLLALVPSLGEQSAKEKQEIDDKRKAEIDEMRTKLKENGGTDTDLKYEIINKIPAYLIAQILFPEYLYDGKKNFRSMGKMKGYFYVSDTNSICNGGSHEFAWADTESCWNCFSMIERQLSLSKADVFKYFENKFSI